ncbi:lipopolysaccharide biosynthesis protein [Oryzobacter telluris]|uniref:lipopolysaccharide biosynthesis protein n=1 Tax=Oryzobacter telluris TaxID=3149179 RepID=UPI00370D04C7
MASADRNGAGVVGGAVVAGAIAVMNVTTYGLTLATARILGPDQFGQFSSVLGALIVVNVVSLALQATGARRVSTAPGDRHRIERTVLRATAACAVGVTVVSLLATPLVSAGLRLDSPVGAVSMAVAAGFLTLMGGQAGILQGEQRWLPLAAVYAAMGVARLAAGGLALLVDRSAASALVGVAIGAVVPVVVAGIALRHPARTSTRPPVGAEPASSWRTWERGGVGREVAHSAHALLAFFAVSNIDVLLARALLDDVPAGHYAAGLVLTKAMLFLPQFVVIVLFPAMARSHGGRRTHVLGLGAILALGVVAASVVALVSGLALAFVGGPAYAPVEPSLPLFAALGTVLAMVQLLVYSALAQRHPRAVISLWVALAATAALAPLVDSASGLLLVKLGVDVVLLLVLGVHLLVVTPRGDAPAPPPVEPALAEDTSSPEQPAVR